jgi:hypothetical protein
MKEFSMSTSSRVSASAVLTVFLFGFASLPASAAGLCYDSGTHSMVPCGGSGVPESVEQVINNATQQAVDTAIQNATEAATRAAESAAAEQASTATENSSPATPQAAVSQAPTISSLDDLYANMDYFLNLPLDSDIVQTACGSCDGSRWAMIQSELRRAAALWTSGMTAAEVAFVEGRMSSIMSRLDRFGDVSFMPASVAARRSRKLVEGVGGHGQDRDAPARQARMARVASRPSRLGI